MVPDGREGLRGLAPSSSSAMASLLKALLLKHTGPARFCGDLHVQNTPRIFLLAAAQRKAIPKEEKKSFLAHKVDEYEYKFWILSSSASEKLVVPIIIRLRGSL